MPLDDYPPVAFHFRAEILGSGDSSDSNFVEVSGLDVELGVEEVAEGGENRFAHRLPRTAKYSNLVLRRGVVPKSSPLADWAAQTLGSRFTQPFVTHDLLVTLLDESAHPVLCWKVIGAYPVKLKLDGFNAMESKVLIETLELSYRYFERTQPSPGAGTT